MTALAKTFDVGLSASTDAGHIPVVVRCRSCKFSLLTVSMFRDEERVAEHFYSTGHVDFSVERADKADLNEMEEIE